jgi:hypothetical protein
MDNNEKRKRFINSCKKTATTTNSLFSSFSTSLFSNNQNCTYSSSNTNSSSASASSSNQLTPNSGYNNSTQNSSFTFSPLIPAHLMLPIANDSLSTTSTTSSTSNNDTGTTVSTTIDSTINRTKSIDQCEIDKKYLKPQPHFLKHYRRRSKTYSGEEFTNAVLKNNQSNKSEDSHEKTHSSVLNLISENRRLIITLIEVLYNSVLLLALILFPLFL